MIIRALLILLVSSYAFAEPAFPETLPDDPRKIRTNASPKWLEAVGRVVSEKDNGTQEQCTLSVVVNQPTKDGVIGLTAGLCVDHWITGNGEFQVEKNTVTFWSNTGEEIQRSIVEILKARMADGDYAIVKLNTRIPRRKISPLVSSPYEYSDLLDRELFGDEYEDYPDEIVGKVFNPYATIAGYSADTTLGQKGKVLTYHERCQLKGGGPGDKKAYCYSYQGASGGPVVVTVDLHEFGDDYGLSGTQHLIVGTIVGSEGNDNSSKTMWTNTGHYSQTLDRILQAH